MTNKKILIADDDENILVAIKMHLKSIGYQCDCVQSPDALIHAITDKAYDLLLMDLNYHHDTTSGQEGLNLIKQIRQFEEYLPIVVMTGWATIDIAVSAMRLGANDFLEKPCDNNRLKTTVENLISLSAIRKQSTLLSIENQLIRAQHLPDEWICNSKAMQDVMDKVGRVAASEINILITGDNGTGKSQLAELIHKASARSDGALVNVNMGAINEQVFESELFGHVKGAFTDAKANRLGRIELANEGTLFMDEIANIPLSQQAKLLKVLESGQFEKLGSSQSQQANVRVVSATNGDLNAMIGSGKFRKDLLYRLNGIEIRLPSLVKRPEDILPLANQFIKKNCQKYGRAELILSSEAQDALQEYSWPGNIRELQHLMERAVLLATGEQIFAEDLMLPSGENNQSTMVDDWTTLTMEEAEKKLIGLVLNKHKGNAKEAAESLGYSKSAFYRRLEKFDIQL